MESEKKKKFHADNAHSIITSQSHGKGKHQRNLQGEIEQVQG